MTLLFYSVLLDSTWTATSISITCLLIRWIVYSSKEWLVLRIVCSLKTFRYKHVQKQPYLFKSTVSVTEMFLKSWNPSNSLQEFRLKLTFYNQYENWVLFITCFFFHSRSEKEFQCQFNVYFEPGNARSYIISNLENMHYRYRNEIFMPAFNIITHTHLLCSSWRPVGEVSNAYALLNELSKKRPLINLERFF